MATMDKHTKMSIPLVLKCEFDMKTGRVKFSKLTELLKLRRGAEQYHKAITDCGAKILFWGKKEVRLRRFQHWRR